MTTPTILIVGTCDTKADEIDFMADCIRDAGGVSLLMDVSILRDSRLAPDFTKDDVAAAAGTTNAEIIALGSESPAMAKTAEGASKLAARLEAEGRIDGIVILGGTMGTDLSLDVAMALPVGVPKVVISTVAFSPLIPADRIAPDLIMVLWAGGLYGLNEMSKAALRNACGSVVGAARIAAKRDRSRPIVAISSLGLSALTYMATLVPELEKRGYEAAVFHATGMGGRAMATLAQKGELVAIFDLCQQEMANFFAGSRVNAGSDRLHAPGIPRLVGPAGLDMIDALAAEPIPPALSHHDFYEHNRLITCALATNAERAAAAKFIAGKLAEADAPTVFLLPNQGIGDWDREDGPLHNPEALAVMCQAFRESISDPVELRELDCHINDPLYVETALAIFDRWVADGAVPPGAST